MELIKQIKEAESQAKQILEQAKVDAVKLADEAKTKHADMLAQAEQERKQAIDAAVTKAETASMGDVENLKADAARRREELQADVKPKIESCVAKVMQQLTG